jgi:uncharacterized protein (TIGR02646 family)
MGGWSVKLSAKLPEPPTLSAYRTAQPDGTWNDMRDDPLHGGQQAYRDIKRTLLKAQRCLCAFCETKLADGTSDAQLDARKHEQRVEHFHPKSDMVQPPNWALDWPNLWAVCMGGSNPDKQIQEDVIYPLPENLSCDAYKEYQVSVGKLPAAPEGWILAPNETPAFPPLFQYSPDGVPEPNPDNCASVTLPNNQYPDTITLVSKTVEHLNLGCPRLNRNRLVAKATLEKMITFARTRSPGAPPEVILTNLARRYFSNDPDSAWCEFFSLIRWRLGATAEQHLQSIHFNG